MPWQDAVQDTPGGVRLLLEVTPGAKQPLFPAGFNPWRGRIAIRVQAPALEGRANREVCAVVAKHFGLPASAATIVFGENDTRKALVLRGLTAENAVLRLGLSL